MELNAQTKLTDILKEYPGLVDLLIQEDSRFAMAKTAMGRLMIRNKTIQDAADMYHAPVDQVIAMLKERLAKLG